jgi:CRISPR-associated protein Cst2
MSTCAIGLTLFDMPGSALNCKGTVAEGSTENTVGVKLIYKGRQVYPYVSSQAFRYWWRQALKENANWNMSPIERDRKIAFTHANPMDYEDDDVFGYMRAQKGSDTLTRISPLKCSPLISVVAQHPTTDFGVMARHEGDPVPYETQLYAATMKGAFSLDLAAVGAFCFEKRAGYLNINEDIKKEFLANGADEVGGKVVLNNDLRAKRAAATMEVLAYLAGGAKRTLYFTDVVPKLVVLAILDGGNHPLMSLVRENNKEVILDLAVLTEVIADYGDRLKSSVYIGRSKGFMEECHDAITSFVEENSAIVQYHSVKASLELFAGDIKNYYKD